MKISIVNLLKLLSLNIEKINSGHGQELVVYSVENPSSSNLVLGYHRKIIPYIQLERCIEHGIVESIDSSYDNTNVDNCLEIRHVVSENIISIFFNPPGEQCWILDVCVDAYPELFIK